MKSVFKTRIRALLAAAMPLVVGFGTFSCTRDVDRDAVLRLSMPSSINTGQSVMELEVVIFNIRTGAGAGLPMVKEIDHHQLENMISTTGTTDTLDFVLDHYNMHQPIPKGVVMVQYLGVFVDTGDVLRFSYGDTVVDTSAGGDVFVEINASFLGATVTKEGHAGGRYYNSPTGGPTGVMVGYFQPPNGKPRMAVTKEEMYNGWFNIFLLDNVDFTYEMLDGTPVFSNVNLTNFAATGNHVLKVTKPASYYPEWDPGEGPEEDAERDLIIGFFSNGNGPSFAGHEVCFPDVKEAIPYMFNDNTLTANLVFKGPSHSPAATDIRQVAGGVARSYTDIHQSGLCDMDALNRIRFYPQQMREWDDGPFGMRGPFRLIRPFEKWGGYSAQSFNGSNAITLNWKYLPEVGGVAVHGATVFAGYNNWNSDDGDHGDEDPPCNEELTMKGMNPVGELSGTAESYVFSGGTGGMPPVDNNNHHNFRLAVCPYFVGPQGQRHYMSEYVENDCSGDCGQMMSYGVGTTDATIASGTASATMGASYARLDGTSTSPVESTGLSLSSVNGSFAPGDEVLIHVSGYRQAGDCGYWNGEEISPGMQAFARVIVGGGGSIYISKGTFLDSASTAYLANAASAPNMCRIQVVKVLQYRDLTINGLVFLDSFSTYMNGGILPIRVNGTMNLNANINGMNAGYGGVASVDGSGLMGASTNTGTGGQGDGGGHGAGGGGYGNGGNASTGANGGMGGNDGGSDGGFGLIMGSGGGSAGAIAGGTGGGAIMIAARKIAVTSSGATLVVDGGAGTVSANTSGGGGGGTINIFAKEIVRLGAGAFTLSANGGNGDANAGAGGGGRIKVMACQGSSEVTATNNAGAGFGSAQPGNQTNGDGNMIIEDANQWHDFCRQ
ncbi:MAG: hypothetical protein H6624_04275 [Bdellovibrionaceae bacterium]|nr:hypothetical protein [Bdellovibrionales bacterium]MCB9083532.1 hypothetical protein [Pseudobdellovibrionaceae bacterium]